MEAIAESRLGIPEATVLDLIENDKLLGDEEERGFVQLVDNLRKLRFTTEQEVLYSFEGKMFFQGHGILKLMLRGAESAAEDGGEASTSGMSANSKMWNNLVKLQDIVANAFKGELKSESLLPEAVAGRVLFSIILCHHVVEAKALKAMSKTHSASVEFLASLLGSAIVNFSASSAGDKALKEFILTAARVSPRPEIFAEIAPLSDLYLNMKWDPGKEALVKAVIRHSLNISDIDRWLGHEIKAEQQPLLVKILLLSRQSFSQFDSFSRFLCYLCSTTSPVCAPKKLTSSTNPAAPGSFSLDVLLKTLDLWADPVIAKAHVSAEIIHYSKLVLAIFCHVVTSEGFLRPDQNIKYLIVERLARGIPNHFNSTDYRTVILARFLSSIITESIKHYEGNEASKEFLKDEEFSGNHLCKELLEVPSSCCCLNLSGFWLREDFASMAAADKAKPGNASEQSSTSSKLSSTNPNEILDSDDEEDDLKPIESNVVPPKRTVRYIRDFLEKLPEMKTFDEVNSALTELPEVVKYQLNLEAPVLGKELLDALFFWENQFEEPSLDSLRRKSLKDVLVTKAEGNVQHFCRYFHRGRGGPGLAPLEPYRKNLILDVLTLAAEEMCLKDLGILAGSAFDLILSRDIDCIRNEDVSVKIPMILFFGHLISGNSLPREMVREDMVVSYLRSLTRLGTASECASTNQTVRYAIHRLAPVIEHLQFVPAVQSSIKYVRTWLSSDG